MAATTPSLGLEVKVAMPYEQAIAKVTAALKEQGFGVLTSIDVQATLKQKLGVDFRPYTILGACNPPLAHKALSADLDMGLLLPCNVIVYAVEDGTVISIADPLVMLRLADNPALNEMAQEARARLERVVAALAS
jgi:uncharacterized protein (DUF302 family)